MHAMQDEAGAPLTTAADPTPSTPAPVPTGGRRRLYAVLLGLAAGVLVLDQATKVWALRALTPGEAVDVIGSFSFLTHFTSIQKGVIDLRDIIYFATLIAFWLYANMLAIEATYRIEAEVVQGLGRGRRTGSNSASGPASS